GGASVGRVQAVARAAKAGGAKAEGLWAAGVRRTADPSSPGTCHAPESLPRRLLPAAARRRPREAGRTLAVSPRPETGSRADDGARGSSAYTSRWGRWGAPARARRRMPPP